MDSYFDTEHLYRSYFKMAFPLVLGMVVTLIYNLADTFFISQTNDTNLIAGVSLCAPVFTALMAFGNIYGQGGSSLISRLLGEKNIEGTKKVSSFCFYIAIITGVVLAILMCVFSTPILNLLGASSETFKHAYDYYIVLSIGAPIVVLSFIHSNLIRCEGLANESMIGSVLGTVINIILDPILISGFNMGALGAAIATVFGYFCSVIYFLFIVNKKCNALSINPSICRVNKDELGQILGVGITAALSNLMQSIVTIIINQFLLTYGNDKIAAMGIALKINMIAQLILTGFAFSAVPLFGYLYGAKDHKNLMKLIKFCLAFLVCLSLVLTIFLYICATPLTHVFLEDTELISVGSTMLRYQSITTVFAGIVLLLTVLFQATGKVLPALIMSISRQGIVFIVVVIILKSLLGYDGVILSQAFSDVISAIVGIIVLFVCNPTKVESSI